MTTKRQYQRSALTNAQERYLLGQVRNACAYYRISRDETTPARVTKAQAVIDAWETSLRTKEHAKREEARERERIAIEAVLFAESPDAAKAAVDEYHYWLDKRGLLKP